MDLCIRNIATDETLCLPEYFGDFALMLRRVVFLCGIVAQVI